MTFNDVESARKIYHEKRTRIIKRSAVIFLAVAAIIFFATKAYSDMATLFMVVFMTAFFGFVIEAVIIAFATNKYAVAYQKAYKGYFVEKSLSSVFTNVVYNHATGLDRNLLRSTGMVNTGDRFHSNDLTIAKYRNVSFAEADVHIETEHTDSDGNTTYTTIFRGRYMLFEFPKKFTFKLELIGKRFYAARIPSGTAVTVNGKPSKPRKLSRLHTESTDFDKSYKLYAEDGFETYYLLTPDIIDQLNVLAARYRNSLFFGFLNNTLIVGLNDGKDAFEPPRASKPIDEAAETAKVMADIKVITDFVDLLKLDRKIFTD